MAYSNESIRRKGSKIVTRTVETRLKFGAKILEGIRTGDFEKKKDGKWVPISSDPKSENYWPTWKEHLKQHAADVIELLAIRVFDVPVQALSDEDDDEADDAADDPASPEGSAETSGTDPN